MAFDTGALVVLIVGIGVLAHVGLNILADSFGLMVNAVLGAALVVAGVTLHFIRRKQTEAAQ